MSNKVVSDEPKPGAGSAEIAGLEALEKLPDSVYIQQKIDILESVAAAGGGCTCCEQANTYALFDGSLPKEKHEVGGEGHLFTVEEVSKKECMDICCRCLCNPWHPMTLNIRDAKNNNAVVFTIDRPFKCCGLACFPCCLQEWNVLEPNQSLPGEAGGQQIGAVTQPLCGGGFCPKFNMIEGSDVKAEPYEFLTGNHCMGELPCCEVLFKTVNAQVQEETGTITKVKAEGGKGMCAEMVTDADNFNLTLPKDLSIQRKAIALTSLVLLDYYFFESGGAFACNPCANPGQECCRINLCTQYCCGAKCTYKCALARPQGEAAE